MTDTPPPTLTPEEIAELKELMGKADLAPWQLHQDLHCNGSVNIDNVRGNPLDMYDGDTLKLIIATHNALPGLIAAAERVAAVEHLFAGMADPQKECDALANERDHLRERLEKNILELDEAIENKNEWKTALDRSNAERDTLAAKCEAFEAERDQIDAMAYRRGAYELDQRLKPEVDALKRQLAEITKERNSAVQKVEVLRVRHNGNKHLQSQVDALQAALATAEEERDRWERDASNINQLRSAIMIDRDETLRRLETLQAALDRSEYRFTSCAKTLGDIAEWINQQRLSLPMEQDGRLQGWRNTLQALSAPTDKPTADGGAETSSTGEG